MSNIFHNIIERLICDQIHHECRPDIVQRTAAPNSAMQPMSLIAASLSARAYRSRLMAGSLGAALVCNCAVAVLFLRVHP